MKYLFYIFILILLFINCNKSHIVECPNITTDDLSWVSFNDNNTQQYYYYKKDSLGNFNFIRKINSSISFNSQRNPEGCPHFFYECKINILSEIEIYMYKVDSGLKVGFYFKYYQENRMDGSNHKVGQLTLSNKTFDDVFIYENISTQKEEIKTAYFKKGIGFLKLEYNNGDKVELIP